MQNIYFKQTNIIFSKTKMIMKQNYSQTVTELQHSLISCIFKFCWLSL